MWGTITRVTTGHSECSYSRCATDGVHSVRVLPKMGQFDLLAADAVNNLDAESQVEEYERILSADIKIPSKKGYSAECRDLQSRVSFGR